VCVDNTVHLDAASSAEDELVTVVVGRFEPLLARGLEQALHEDRRLRLLGVDLQHAPLERAVLELAPRVAIVAESEQRLVSAAAGSISPPTGVLVLARKPDRAYGMGLLAAGASCIAVSASVGEVLAAVHLVAQGGRVFASADGGRVERSYPPAALSLTPRESEVLEHLSRGAQYAEIGLALGIGVETVRTHATSVREKLGVAANEDLIGMPAPRQP
jgi:DNA-binding NarL/FixJ family response regulator